MIKAKTENHYCVKTSDWGNLSRLVDNFQGFKMACFQAQSWIALPVFEGYSRFEIWTGRNSVSNPNSTILNYSRHI